MRKLRIATRKSPLALWQAEHIKQKLQTHHPELQIELLGLTTEGDQHLDSSLQKAGGKGLFVKELEKALLDQRADIAVHSMKDVPMDFPAGLILPVICEREDPRDVLVANQYQTLQQLPQGATIGSSSLRRQCQIKALRPDLKIELLRGNVNTRIDKLDAGKYDAIILAAAGLIRLQMANRITAYLPPQQCLPAAGQGALGIECRQDDQRILDLITPLTDLPSYHCVTTERAMTKRLGSGCEVPVAAYATLENNHITLRGLVGKPDGSLLLHVEVSGNIHDAEKIGITAAENLLAQGAEEILSNVNSTS